MHTMTHDRYPCNNPNETLHRRSEAERRSILTEHAVVPTIMRIIAFQDSLTLPLGCYVDHRRR
jgi:hypothetical protein